MSGDEVRQLAHAVIRFAENLGIRSIEIETGHLIESQRRKVVFRSESDELRVCEWDSEHGIWLSIYRGRAGWLAE